MSDQLHGAGLLRRAATEHRRALLVLGIALAANLLLYGLFVYPLSQRVANVENRNRAAEAALAAARAEHDAARGTLTGKDRAEAELATFYQEVLPPDLAGARRLTHLRLAQLARESNLDFQRGSYEPVEERGSTLRRLEIRLILSGSYDDMRTFIYQLETAPEFVVIDDVHLAEGADVDAALTLTLQLSTYYRAGNQ